MSRQGTVKVWKEKKERQILRATLPSLSDLSGGLAATLIFTSLGAEKSAGSRFGSAESLYARSSQLRSQHPLKANNARGEYRERRITREEKGEGGTTNGCGGEERKVGA